MSGELIKSIEMFIRRTTESQARWSTKGRPWFRGQRVDKPLLPRLFREKYDENEIVQIFRMKSPTLYEAPDRQEWDKWLFLMQHFGAPTRLLDWTEGALVALYFAIYKFREKGSDPVVWMMDPLIMNQLSIGQMVYPLSFSLVGITNFHYAFDKSVTAHAKPVALYPVEVHVKFRYYMICILSLEGQCFESKLLQGRLKALLNASIESAILGNLQDIVVDINTGPGRLGKYTKNLIGLRMDQFLSSDLPECRKSQGEVVFGTERAAIS